VYCRSRPKERLLAIVVCVLATFVVMRAPAQEDARSVCYGVNSGEFYVSGNVFRQAALKAVSEKMDGAQELRAVARPQARTRCDDSSFENPLVMPQEIANGEYFGNIDNKQKFLNLSAKCQRIGQFFSISGKEIYYRRCVNDYVYYWGQASREQQLCFKEDYPSLFGEAGQVRLDQMRAVYNGGGIEDSRGGAALGNAMAAILIGEVSRDWLVLVENYILIDKLSSPPWLIIGGRCLAGSGSS
jgi:hypothetical protein